MLSSPPRHATGTPLPVVLFVVAAVLTCCLGEAAAQGTPALQVVLNEIAWMGTTTSATDEWIELFNNTPSAIHLAGWTLTAADGTPGIVLSGSIPAGAYFLLERGRWREASAGDCACCRED